MIDLNNSQPEIEFPVNWTYRLLCENTEEVKKSLTEKLTELNVKGLQSGNISKTGKYITFKVNKTVNSLEELHGFPKELQSVSGIKQIL